MPYRGEIAALTAVVLWGSTAILFDSAGKRVGALVTNLIRLSLACFFLCLTNFIVSGQLLPLHASREQQLWLGLSGIVGLALGDAALFETLVILGARLATLLLSLAPVFTTILAWLLLGEKLSPLALFGILLTISGVFWVVNEEHHDSVHGSKSRGIMLGVLSALGQGAGVILAKYGFRTEIDALPATILRIVPATLVMWMAALLWRRASSIKILRKDRKAARFIFIASILGPYLGVWLANVAVKYTEAGIAATLLSIVPIVVIPMIWVVRGTKPSLRAVAGTILAIIGVALIFLR